MNQEEIKNRIYELSEKYDEGNDSEGIEKELKEKMIELKVK